MEENTEQANTQEPETQAPLSPEDATLLAQARELQAEGFSIVELRQQRADLRTQARDLEVRSIVAALEARQEHPGVTVVEGHRHYPAVITAAERLLRGEGLGFSLEVGQDGRSVVDQVVLDVLNALPRETRLALDTAPQRPSREAAEDSAPAPAQGFRTEPLPPEQAEEVTDEQIDQFVDHIT